MDQNLIYRKIISEKINPQKELAKILFEDDNPIKLVSFYGYSEEKNAIYQMSLNVHIYSSSINELLEKMEEKSKKRGYLFLLPTKNLETLNTVLGILEELTGKKIDTIQL
jgi:hypothetical protein